MIVMLTNTFLLFLRRLACRGMPTFTLKESVYH